MTLLVQFLVRIKKCSQRRRNFAAPAIRPSRDGDDDIACRGMVEMDASRAATVPFPIFGTSTNAQSHAST